MREDEELHGAGDTSPGWDAVDASLNRLYAGVEPFHYGTMISYRLGGPDPLEGVSVYAREEPVPHWHYVTYGFTELHEKESRNAEYSGFGFELTLRLAREGEEQPPVWAINFLQNLARYVFNSGNGFQPGHHLDANGPIEADRDTPITAVAFVEDPELGSAVSPFGRFRFVQAVGITGDELDLIKVWNTRSFLELAKPRLPLYLTDLNRHSLLEEPDLRSAAELGVRAEGSNTGSLYFESLVWEERRSLLKGNSYVLELGAKQAESLARILMGRLMHNRDLTLIGPDAQVMMIPDLQNRVVETESDLHLYLNADAAAELSRRLLPKEGEFRLETMKTLTIRIVKTLLRDPDGNVVETIG
ncbi:suppressor of fused domain protein [Saccharibacillus alkalitolerans]|uniref:Suppressor of fused domain protein n=1 Tax=Saccharibacillus alkalitolerans TaxID=2705290 RepID=A0ABX0F334_9BACL|nr:suppressor of fused domain protein [Saccharibacillus alkalitolerans]NGZ74024.1 suppressor of fused domain protein [Saccharibacillus alkalitolerans]